ncbi:MAG: hypothetical protein A2722_02655 [Candidatus Doudnabacteria bacterium RIFCSPHIGHO2_01_FULL_50_11]|uniref:Beta-glucosidase n=1 Tax=Candidatus Doudnabacteria bacterium RIFCSPHIGHO2_01_FULL_50_11 TaxID=1817828 RepID=A0A1F5PLM7_9BACT|nr:MAG: hypothetical protein A2722_02655 [Candidatus Doudnabacteria bacterium RIFCSPHIGHO2_01_FULL_50_11]HLC45077.1 glycoside hydrolase family 1 protein [Patescibacteria group bacterium]
MENKKITFPEGFLWGAAISAHQTEGNNINSNWWAWEHSERRASELRSQGRNPAEYVSGQACDFYHRYESDFDLLTKLNMNAFRLSIEWARLEPQQGWFDRDEVEHYRRVLEALKKRGIKTFVTLHHFTLPQWFAERGGFTRKANIPLFLNYVRLAAEEFSPLVDFWVTINEPEIYGSHSYILGRFPPQRKSHWLTFVAVNTLIACHNQAYPILKKYNNVPVGLAYHLVDLVPTSIYSRFTRDVMHYITNRYVLRRTIRRCDYIGVNYYGHSHVGVWGRKIRHKTHHMLTDLDWAIHPDGLERVLLDLRKYHKPLYITENGLADAGDIKRERFIHDHLLYTHRAIEQGADVRGYLHWSLMDNFEWAHGFSPRFGLVAVDYPTQARTIRPSALSYAEICKTNTLTV